MGSGNIEAIVTCLLLGVSSVRGLHRIDLPRAALLDQRGLDNSTMRFDAWSSNELLGSVAIHKRLWGSGFDAKELVPHEPVGWPTLEWTEEAESIFYKHWRAVQFPQEGCWKRTWKTGYTSARTDLDWGATSAVRDLSDQLIYSLLVGKPMVYSPFVDKGTTSIVGTMDQYRRACTGSGSWVEDCFFEPLTACTRGGMPWATLVVGNGTSLQRSIARADDDSHLFFAPEWFLEHSKPLWDRMLAARSVYRRSASGRLPMEVGAQFVSDTALEAAHRRGMFRTMLLRTAFRPKKALLEAIAGVENRSGLPAAAARGPVTAVHIRRTDKIKDFQNGFMDSSEMLGFSLGANGTSARSLSTISDVLLPWIERGTASASSLFLMSDDWHTFQPEVRELLTHRLKGAQVQVLFDPDSSRLLPQNVTLLQESHESWGDVYNHSLQVLAESYAAGKWAGNIVGCGSSGVTQLISQLIGGRYGKDPNTVGVWEDDKVVVDALRAAGDGQPGPARETPAP